MAASMWNISVQPLRCRHSKSVYWKCKSLLQLLKTRHYDNHNNQQQQQCRSYSGGVIEKRGGNSTFDNWVANHKAHARRSIIVKLSSRHGVDDVFNFCSTHAPVTNITTYSTEENLELALVEFNSEEEMRHVLKHASYVHENPVYSQFLYFDQSKRDKGNMIKAPVSAYVLPSMTEVHKKLQAANDVTHQMKILYEETKLSEFGARMRFMVCTQIQFALSGIFPGGEVTPFGSSVNGLGKFSCDLDMIYDTESQYLKQEKSLSPLRFQPTFAPLGGMTQEQHSLDIMKDLIRGFVPCCTGIRGILGARVPIVQFNHIFTGLECDLSFHNLTGFYMSELLYLYGECDERVRPLVFTVLRWAKEHSLTHEETGGQWFTNFHLIMLVLFFLQQHPHMIAPPLKVLMSSADQEDVRITKGINCSFLRDVRKFPQSDSERTLHDLLLDFFTFYSSFDFGDRKISLAEGRAVRKVTNAFVEIENPLEPHLNAAKVVSRFELKRFKLALQDTLWTLENDEMSENNNCWGILQIFKPVTEKKKTFDVGEFWSQRNETLPEETGRNQENGKKRRRKKGRTENDAPSGSNKFTYIAK